MGDEDVLTLKRERSITTVFNNGKTDNSLEEI